MLASRSYSDLGSYFQSLAVSLSHDHSPLREERNVKSQGTITGTWAVQNAPRLLTPLTLRHRNSRPTRALVWGQILVPRSGRCTLSPPHPAPATSRSVDSQPGPAPQRGAKGATKVSSPRARGGAGRGGTSGAQ